MKSKFTTSAYLLHIRDAIRKIQTYAQDTTFGEFLNNDWDQDAVIRNLEIIGEALTHIEPEMRKQYPQIPWRKVIALRNILIHAYFGVDLKLVWEVIIKDIPDLKQQIEIMLQESR